MSIKFYIFIWFVIVMGISSKAYAFMDFSFHDPVEIILEREKLQELSTVDMEHQDEFIAKKLEVLQKNRELIEQKKSDIQQLKADIEDIKLLIKQQEVSALLDQQNLTQEIASLLKYIDVLESYIDQLIQKEASHPENEMYLLQAYDDLSMVLMAYYFDYLKDVQLPRQFIMKPPVNDTQDEGGIIYKEEDPTNFFDHPDRSTPRDKGDLSPVSVAPLTDPVDPGD